MKLSPHFDSAEFKCRCCDYGTNPGKYGVGRYQSFTHLDVRRNKARWGNN